MEEIGKHNDLEGSLGHKQPAGQGIEKKLSRTWTRNRSVCLDTAQTGGLNTWRLQGGFDPSKKSGVGVDFGLVVRCLLLRNKDAARKPSMI